MIIEYSVVDITTVYVALMYVCRVKVVNVQ